MKSYLKKNPPSSAGFFLFPFEVSNSRSDCDKNSCNEYKPDILNDTGVEVSANGNPEKESRPLQQPDIPPVPYFGSEQFHIITLSSLYHYCKGEEVAMAHGPAKNPCLTTSDGKKPS